MRIIKSQRGKQKRIGTSKKEFREVTYMFFKSKKEKAQKTETAPVIEKKDLLYRENIRTGCAPTTKQEAILAA